MLLHGFIRTIRVADENCVAASNEVIEAIAQRSIQL